MRSSTLQRSSHCTLRFAFRLAFFLTVGLLTTVDASAQTDDAPGVVFWDKEWLQTVKEKIADDKSFLKDDTKRLKKAAKKARKRGPYTVTDKKELPPSRDKHDYLSFSRYWWPDPDKPDGLPYIRRDGKVNRKLVSRGDRDRIGGLLDDIVPLALAGYLLDDEDSAEHGAKLLRVWFLDEATRMNPHLKYAQGVPGKSSGRGVGIIDARGYIWLLDSVALLESSGALSEKELKGLQDWFGQFLNWLRTSRLARSEKAAENNHGSWYAALVCRIALFAEKPDVVRKMAEDVKTRRIPDQVADDGSQPYELERTLSQHYSYFNLAALTVVARMADHVDVNVWDSELKDAVAYLAGFANDDAKWPYKQLGDMKLSLAEKSALHLLAERYEDVPIKNILKSTPVKNDETDFTRLQFESANDLQTQR